MLCYYYFNFLTRLHFLINIFKKRKTVDSSKVFFVFFFSIHLCGLIYILWKKILSLGNRCDLNFEWKQNLVKINRIDQAEHEKVFWSKLKFDYKIKLPSTKFYSWNHSLAFLSCNKQANVFFSFRNWVFWLNRNLIIDFLVEKFVPKSKKNILSQNVLFYIKFYFTNDVLQISYVKTEIVFSQQ